MFVYRRRVAFSETDMAGIVHFANFFRYMEEAEHALFRSLDLPKIWHLPDGSVIGWPRVQVSCQYQSTAMFDDELEIRLNIDRVGGSSLTMSFEIYRGETRLAKGSMKTACIVRPLGESMRAVEMPVEYAEKLGAIENPREK